MTPTVEAEVIPDEPAIADTALVAVPIADALVLRRDPNDMLAEAAKAAKALMTVMAGKKDKVMLNGQQYIENEDWQTIGHFYGASAQLESDRFVEFGTVQGWEATVILVARDGRTLGRASAMCLNDEEKWSSRAKYEWHYVMKDGSRVPEEEARRRGNAAMVWEETGEKKPDGSPKARPKKERVEVGTIHVPMFQLRSMAQTRASSKVHRTVLAFVPVLAGFGATPAEELPDAVRVANAPPPAADVPPGVDPQTGEVLDAGTAVVTVTKVDSRKGETNGRPWTLHIVTFSDGKEGSTLEDNLAIFAKQCRDSQIAVDRVLEQGKRPGTFQLVELQKAQPTLITDREPGQEG